MPDFLLEIGCEEIPARMIDAASKDLYGRVLALLVGEKLAGPAQDGVYGSHYSTPRRLAVMFPHIRVQQPDVREILIGPSTKVAFKDGSPTSAAHAFAKKANVDVSQLEKTSTPKGEYLSAKVTKKGRAASEVLSELLPREINSLYWPKNMYWRKRSVRSSGALAGGDAR